jgi:[ribosomal protein S5]-alanine N-acetyltransferase
MNLIEIGEAGELAETSDEDGLVRAVAESMAGVYRTNGFVRPWIGYLAVEGQTPVGTCGFKSPPQAGRVEIAYFTFPGQEGRGVATAMAGELVHLAQQTDADLVVFAQTLPEENASTAVLKKLGFRLLGPVQHPEDGTVWEWELVRVLN